MTRYVLRELATPTLLALSFFTFVLLMNQLFLVAEKALAKNLPMQLVVKLLVIAIPNLMILAIYGVIGFILAVTSRREG